MDFKSALWAKPIFIFPQHTTWLSFSKNSYSDTFEETLSLRKKYRMAWSNSLTPWWVKSQGLTICRFEQGLMVQANDNWDVYDVIRQLSGEPNRWF